MKKALQIIFLLNISFTGFTQSYLGLATTQVNLREGPGTEFAIIRALPAGTQLFIISLEEENGFYNVINIQTNEFGFVSKAYVKLGEEVPENKEGIFTKSGNSDTYNPEVEVYNNTIKTLTLKLNSANYTFIPQEKKKITLPPGTYKYIASAPGVIPYYGNDSLLGNYTYTWEFYIVTEHN